MKPARFDYQAPRSLAEAVGALSDLGDDARVLAGGQSLVPMLNMRLARFGILVDLNRIDELKTVAVTEQGVRVGAMVRQSDVEVCKDIAATAPLLTRATPLIGHFQIRNRGTVGGSIAHADPAAEYPAVALALDAEMELVSLGGTRRLSAGDFFTGTWDTAARTDEVLAAVTFPSWGRAGFAIDEVGRRHGDFAMAGACAAIQLDPGERVERAAISLFGVGATPVRAHPAEAQLIGSGADDVEPEAVGSAAAADLDPPDDLHATSGLRRRIAAVLVSRVVGAAVREARA